ncbi:peptidoglycan-binding domain-containing protein [Streptomyces triticirhizae]|uniref:Peptidoglycan-binding protein n=1 Tax=Streptomyces triticirhizae TaxID=2483353 RepID=A0A3M2LEG8_9ACTN|nr:peptidoglycan-binding domain-containing protein [Streptomyces triticirhizae]RMI33078.1 peptidoglycan-binding protein [Streptomyces triticirhizae]
MTDRLDCLICGRLWLPSGEPSCDCLTHSLSRPVGPPQHDPDPADVALFPLEEERPRSRPPTAWRPSGPGLERLGVEPLGVELPEPDARPHPSHRKPRHRNRISLAAGGAVAAVVGCTALAASFLNGGGGRNEEAFETVSPLPSLVMPDGDGQPDDQVEADRNRRTPAPDEPEPTHRPSPPEETEAPPPVETEPTHRPPEPTEPEPTRPTSPSPTEPEPDPTPTQPEPDPTPTDPDPTPGPEESLSEGDEGPEVVELQQRMLQLRWVYNGQAHGFFDTQTREAVARFQTAYGITGDPPGVYGPATRAVLEEHTTQP